MLKYFYVGGVIVEVYGGKGAHPIDIDTLDAVYKSRARRWNGHGTIPDSEFHWAQ